MVAYFRSRTRLWAAAGLLCGGILLAWNAAFVAPQYLREYAIRNDLRLDFGAAEVGLHRGYGHLYDLAAQRSAIEGLGAGFNPQPFISPPPLAWLVTPLLAVPFIAALAIWTALLLAGLAWTWWLLAPGGTLGRAAHLALMLGLFPVAFGVLVGQPTALVAAAVASAWWLITRGHQVGAGLVLSAILVKPQLALLVPPCLLLAGYRRTFVAWLVAAAVVGGVALALLGVDGVNRYREVLAQTQTPAWGITRRYSISGLLGLGLAFNAVQAVDVAVALFAAWRAERGRPEIALASGIVGSLLFSPYVAFQDLLMLVVAAWLVIRAGARPAQMAFFVLGYALLELAVPALAGATIVAEALFLVSLAVWSRRWDSNPRPATYEAAALPAELRRQNS